MSFDSEFNVNLIKGTEGSKEEFDTESSLPQTGSMLNSNLMLMVGSIITCTGYLLNRKKNKKLK